MASGCTATIPRRGGGDAMTLSPAARVPVIDFAALFHAPGARCPLPAEAEPRRLAAGRSIPPRRARAARDAGDSRAGTARPRADGVSESAAAASAGADSPAVPPSEGPLALGRRQGNFPARQPGENRALCRERFRLAETAGGTGEAADGAAAAGFAAAAGGGGGGGGGAGRGSAAVSGSGSSVLTSSVFSAASSNWSGETQLDGRPPSSDGPVSGDAGALRPSRRVPGGSRRSSSRKVSVRFRSPQISARPAQPPGTPAEMPEGTPVPSPRPEKGADVGACGDSSVGKSPASHGEAAVPEGAALPLALPPVPPSDRALVRALKKHFPAAMPLESLAADSIGGGGALCDVVSRGVTRSYSRSGTVVAGPLVFAAGPENPPIPTSRRSRPRERKSTLPPALQGLPGAANRRPTPAAPGTAPAAPAPAAPAAAAATAAGGSALSTRFSRRSNPGSFARFVTLGHLAPGAGCGSGCDGGGYDGGGATAFALEPAADATVTPLLPLKSIRDRAVQLEAAAPPPPEAAQRRLLGQRLALVGASLAETDPMDVFEAFSASLFDGDQDFGKVLREIAKEQLKVCAGGIASRFSPRNGEREAGAAPVDGTAASDDPVPQTVSECSDWRVLQLLCDACHVNAFVVTMAPERWFITYTVTRRQSPAARSSRAASSSAGRRGGAVFLSRLSEYEFLPFFRGRKNRSRSDATVATGETDSGSGLFSAL